jgi:hypothetical protein
MGRTSGRHRAPLPGGRRLGRRLALGAVVVGLAFAGGALQAVLRASSAQPLPQTSPSTIAADPVAPAPPPEGVAFASAKGVTLYLPAEDPKLIAFHEASYPDASELAPIGRLQRNANRTKFRPPKDEKGPRYTVMSSRGRPTPATSAVDVVLPSSTRVRSPVSGVVVQVKPYKLYGRYPDVRVEISVDGHPDVNVVLIHLAHVRVARGDRVSATLSVIGEPRVFPFRSETDDYVRGGDPHVHIEIKKPASTAA